MNAKKPLPWGIRAELFSQLAALERAGLPSDRAWASLTISKPFEPRMAVMRKSLARGKSIAKAGLFAGLFTPLEATLIAAACEAGSPASTYQRIGEQAALNARLSQQVHSRLMKPALMLLLSLLIAPLPQLAAGSMGMASYVLSVAWPLILIAALWRTVKWLLSSAEQNPHSPLSAMILATPFFGDWYLRVQQRNFIASLALLLAAGLPMFSALPGAQACIACARLRKQSQRALRALHSGEPLSSSMAQIPWLNRSEIISLVHTGESSGQLPEMLERVAAGLTADVAHTATQFAAWLPRMIYTALALWMAWGLIGSEVFNPKMPRDL